MTLMLCRCLLTELCSCRMVKDFVTANNVAQIKKLLRVLGQEFALSQNQNSRKGGLIGLAATAIALSRVTSSSFL